MSDEILLLEKDGPVATITLNRPEVMNALSPDLLGELCQAFKRLQADREVLVVILTGNGRAFCAGLDLKAMAAPARAEGGHGRDSRRNAGQDPEVAVAGRLVA